MSEHRRQWTGGVGIAAALAVLTLLAYATLFIPAPGNGFINYDDDVLITDHPVVREGLTAHGLVWAFSSFDGANWFPLTRLSFLLNVTLFGMVPWGFHATSVALHVASSVLLFFALWRLTSAQWPSAVVAAIFGVHPLHVESVAWASCHRDILSGLFFVLTLVAYERHVRAERDGLTGAGRWRPYAAVMICLALGLMAKPTLVTLPFVLLLLDLWPLGRFARSDAGGRSGWDATLVRRAIVEKLPLFALSIGSSAITFAAQQSLDAVQSLERLPLLLRAENALVSYVAYIGAALWPRGLAVFYPHPDLQLVAWHVAASGLFIAGVTLGGLLILRRRPYFAVGWLWFIGTLLPVIGLVQVGSQARADRYMYLPLIGLSIALVWSVRAYALTRAARIASLAVAGVGIVALAIVTGFQVTRWRDTTTLFEHALAVTRDNHIAHNMLGKQALAEGRFEDALMHFTTALRIAPWAPFANAALGELHLRRANHIESEHYYRKALQLEPRNATWRAGLAKALYGMGRYSEAVTAYRSALEIDPGIAQVHVNLGLALAKSDEVEEAILSYERAFRLDPDLKEAHAALGLTLLQAGRVDEAIAHFERTLALDPEHVLVRAYLGQSYTARGEFEAGATHLGEAVRLDPGNASYRYLLAKALEGAGRRESARFQLRRGLADAERSGDAGVEAQLRKELARLE